MNIDFWCDNCHTLPPRWPATGNNKNKVEKESGCLKKSDALIIFVASICTYADNGQNETIS
jgi:hypothetical protein